ncbi:hypothetical protein BK011_03370 [Tenericutes bacterium MZ-XQ]|nr:hypothetical protein BK011_03370 [Tenericutes bacterium MZ-XQ]
MKYKVDIYIDAPIGDVFELYTSQKHFENWEIGLKRIESEFLDIFEKDATSFLIFDNKGQDMKMKMTIKQKIEPEYLDVTYEVKGAYNRCKNKFYNENGKTLWVMDVEFIFEKDMGIPIERFIEKTKSGMDVFKHYVLEHENNK